MPIKPWNRHRYPANWAEIRAAILQRAGHRCERCRVPDRVRIARGAGGDAGTFMTTDSEVFDAETGAYLGQCRMTDFEAAHVTRVVLTVAHLDHVPEHNDPLNLAALCQRCHLAHDREDNRRNAWATRHARSGTPDMFAGLLCELGFVALFGGAYGR